MAKWEGSCYGTQKPLMFLSNNPSLPTDSSSAPHMVPRLGAHGAAAAAIHGMTSPGSASCLRLSPNSKSIVQLSSNLCKDWQILPSAFLQDCAGLFSMQKIADLCLAEWAVCSPEQPKVNAGAVECVTTTTQSASLRLEQKNQHSWCIII